jgi:DNA repair ATPase RecN
MKVEGGFEMNEEQFNEIVEDLKKIANMDKKIEIKKDYDELISDIIKYSKKAVNEMHELDLNDENNRRIIGYRIDNMKEFSELLYVLDKVIN